MSEAVDTTLNFVTGLEFGLGVVAVVVGLAAIYYGCRWAWRKIKA